MSGPAELAIAAGVVLDVGLKATAVFAGGGLACVGLRGQSAAVRHGVWAACFAVVPLLAWFAAQRGPEVAVDAPWVVALWAAGAAVTALPWLVGLSRLARLRRTLRPDPTARGVFHSDQLQSPVMWGAWRPVVVLPDAARSWAPAQRDAALAHERAHIARNDWLVAMGARGLCSLLWFHPLAWWARAALLREAEHAADDVVLEEGVRPSDYASLLLSLARTGPPRGALGAGASVVGERVRAVLARRPRSGRRWPVAVVAGLLAASVLPVWGAWPVWSLPPEQVTCEQGPVAWHPPLLP